jgi:hypothetical protein
VWDSFSRWVPQQIGDRGDILVAMDWTEFDHDSQSTCGFQRIAARHSDLIAATIPI